MKKLTKFVFATMMAVCLVACLAGCGETAVKENSGAVSQINLASGSGGTNCVAVTISDLGTSAITTTFDTSNVYYTRYYSNNDHRNTNYFGDGYFGNGGTIVRRGTTISSASINIEFAGEVADLIASGEVQITVYATVESKSDSDSTCTVGYKFGSSVMSVDTGSSLLSGFTAITSRNTTSSGQTSSGNVTYIPTSTQQYLCIGVGGLCTHTSFIDGKYPAQIAKNIIIVCTER